MFFTDVFFVFDPAAMRHLAKSAVAHTLGGDRLVAFVV